jgi:adenylate cyclase, class 2
MTSNMTETEIKVRWEGDVASALAHIQAHGYRACGPRLLEADQLFDRPPGELRQGGQALRLRISGGTATVTYKGPVAEGPYKSREEIEFAVSDPQAFELVLTRLGYQRLFRYEKFRTKFAEGDGHPNSKGLAANQVGEITLDETPVGIFMELEGPGYWIDAAADGLGFSREKFVKASYAALYMEYRKTHQDAPPDMIFMDHRP